MTCLWGFYDTFLALLTLLRRMIFDDLRTSQLHKELVRKHLQSNSNASCDVNMHLSRVCREQIHEGNHMHRRGAFGVARFDKQGQCEGLQIVERACCAPRFWFSGRDASMRFASRH